jgi:hypothetical protein
MHEMVSAWHDDRARDVLSSCGAWIANEFAQDSPQGAASSFRWASTAAQEQGLLPELSELVARFDKVPELQRTRELVGELGRARGILAAHAGDEDAAAAAFGVGLAAARSAGDRWLTAELLTDYGRCLVSFGRAEEAESLLDEAEGLWEQMGAAKWLDRIAAARSPATVPA